MPTLNTYSKNFFDAPTSFSPFSKKSSVIFWMPLAIFLETNFLREFASPRVKLAISRSMTMCIITSWVPETP